jgi:hypothetical protein
MSPDMVEMSRQASELLAVAGDNSNLLNGLANTSLLYVPSLLVTAGSPGVMTLPVAHPLAAAALFGSFGMLGLLIGVVYMNLLAVHLPIGGGPKPLGLGEFIATALRHWLMMVLYVLLIIAGVIAISIPTLLVAAIFSLISPALSTLFAVLLVAAFSVILFYLYFVTAAIILDNLPVHQAIVRSFVLVRANFWSTLGFVLIYNVITVGFTLLMAQLLTIAPVGALVAIAVNAYIGSGLTMALLVFYRTRLLKYEEQTRLPSR